TTRTTKRRSTRLSRIKSGWGPDTALRSGSSLCEAWGGGADRRRRGAHEWRLETTTPPMLRRARELRSEMTQPEWTLWQMLRRSQTGLRFRREHPVGPYVLDFYCASARLCVEVDGPVHEEPEQVARDAIRDS